MSVRIEETAGLNRWQRYPAYRDSGVDWLGEIPAHWGVVRLKYAVTLNPEVLMESTDPDYEMQYLDIGNVNAQGDIVETQQYIFADAPSRARRIVRHGDVIISTVRTYLKAIGLINDPPENLIVSTGFAVLRAFTASPDFLAFVVQSDVFINAVVAFSDGVSYPAINPTRLANLPIWYSPDRTEQRAIAAFLDRKTGEIDALIAKKRELIARLQEQRSAIISHAVTRGLNPDAPMKDSGIEWLGEIPAHWTVAPLHTRYSVQLGKMLNQDAVKNVSPAPYLRNINVQWDRVDLSDLLEMDFSPQERKKFSLMQGDLLICEGGEVGRTAMWRGELEDCFFQKAIHRVRPYSLTADEPRYLYYVMRNAAQLGVFEAEGNRSTIFHLTAEKLKQHRFAFPGITEQQAIVDLLDREAERVDLMVARIEETISRLQEYRAALISATVTGRIDVREEVS